MGVSNVSAEPLKYLEMHKSVPIEVNGLEFVAATQMQWPAQAEGGGSTETIEVQLLITNRTKRDLAFRTFDTFGVILKTAMGIMVRTGGGRDETTYSPPVIVRAGETYCLSREAKLKWNRPNYMTRVAENAFYYYDGTGMESWFTPLALGKYTLSFHITCTQKQAALERDKLGGIFVWSGEAITKEAPFEIIDAN